LIPEFEKVGESARPNTNQPDEASVDDVLDAGVNHALDEAKDEDAHSLGEVEEGIGLCVIVEFETAEFEAVRVDSRILEAPHQGHHEGQQVELVNAQECKGDESHDNDKDHVDDRDQLRPLRVDDLPDEEAA
jgi:hypothetical protein